MLKYTISLNITLYGLVVDDYIVILSYILIFEIVDALSNIVTDNAKCSTDDGDKNVQEKNDEDKIKVLEVQEPKNIVPPKLVIRQRLFCLFSSTISANYIIL